MRRFFSIKLKKMANDDSYFPLIPFLKVATSSRTKMMPLPIEIMNRFLCRDNVHIFGIHKIEKIKIFLKVQYIILS